MAGVAACSTAEKITFFRRAVTQIVRDAYQRTSHRATSLVRIRHNAFEFIYDNYSYLEVNGTIPYSLIEDRLVAVFGTSEPHLVTRDGLSAEGLGRTN